MPFGFQLAQTLRVLETLAYAAVGGLALGLPGFPAGWLSGAIFDWTGSMDTACPAFFQASKPPSRTLTWVYPQPATLLYESAAADKSPVSL